MKNPFVLLAIGIGVILKLVITGICLSIGFRLGAKVYENMEERRNRKKTVAPEPTVEQAV